MSIPQISHTHHHAARLGFLDLWGLLATGVWWAFFIALGCMHAYDWVMRKLQTFFPVRAVIAE